MRAIHLLGSFLRSPLRSIRDLKFWLYRRKYSVPCSEEMMLLGPFSTSTDRIRRFATLYVMGYSMREIARDFDVTVERVRQMIWKAWRQARAARGL